MATRYRQAESLLALLGLRRVEERVRGFLELLAKDFGEPCEAGLRLNLRLTHQGDRQCPQHHPGHRDQGFGSIAG